MQENKFNQNEYIKQFNKKNYKNIAIRINKKETDLISWLDKQPSKNAYILELIRNDMKKNN